MVKKPVVSVVVATKNEERILAKTLASIKKQTYSSSLIEIIVVDNNSTDKTKQIAQRYTDKVYNQGPERGPQRNFGVKKTKGSILFFPDADMPMSKNLVTESVALLQSSKKIVGLYVPLRWRGENWIIKAKGFEREFYDATCLDALRVVKKEAYLRAGGYDEGLFAAEDWDLNRRILKLGKIALVTGKLFHCEDDTINLASYIKKQRYYSPNVERYIKKYGRNDELIKKQLGFYYRFFKVFVEDGKWKKIINHPKLFLQCYFLKILSGAVFVIEKIKPKK